MGGKSTSTTDKKVASIQIQTSSYGLTIPVVFGTTRVAANLIWFGAFTAIPHTEKTSSGGKGMGSVTNSNTTFTYTAAAIMAVAEGPIAGIGSVWKDKDKTTLADLGLTLFTGTPTQGIWSFLSGYNIPANWGAEQAYGYAGQSASFTDQAINYSSTAYLASPAYDLGGDASVPNHNFEVQGIGIYGGGIVDANPADIVPLVCSSEQYGVGMAAGHLGSLALYSDYCRAAGLFVSPAYVDQQAGADVIKELCDLTNAAPVWSSGVLNIIPYGDTALTGNGATYTPDLTPLFDLSDDDFMDPVDPVRITRATPADAYNRFTLEFLNRANQYNSEIVSTEDQDAIEKFGLKPAPLITAHMICESAIAKQAVELIKQRTLFKRNTYDFELTARFPMLEPMDIVTLTDPGQSMTRLPVRIIEINEQDDSFSVVAEDMPIGVGAAARYTHDNGLRWQSIIATPPQHAAAPIIFELPSDSSSTGLSLAIAAGGQTSDPIYGGCRVWLSLDGTNYAARGIIYGSSRYGLTTASLPAHAAGPDGTSTLALALRSNGQMISGSAADVQRGTTLIYCGGEYLAYRDATLTGVNAYDMTTLNRGLYKTPTGAQASGAPWVRVDDAIAVLKDLDLTLIGQTVYIKLTAFNSYATAEEDLSAVSATTYTITGAMRQFATGPTTRYPEAIPDLPAIGSIYIDAAKRQYRFEGKPLLFGGASLMFGGDPIYVSGWVDVQDEAIAIAGTTAEWDSVLGATKPEDLADVTLLVTGSKTVQIAFDYLAAIKAGQLPLDANFKLVSGASTDVTTSATWTATLKSGTATFTIGSATGTLNVTAFSSDAVIEVKASYGGKQRVGALTLVKNQDAPPATGTGSGTSASASINATAITSSYGASPTGVMTAKAGAGGQVQCSTNPDFYKATAGTVGAYGKWQWRVVGGSFADITSEIASTVSAVRVGGAEPSNEPGVINVTMTKTGLTAGTSYEFQFLMRSAGANIDAIGNASAVGS